LRVEQAPNIVARLGTWQVGQVVSGKWGAMITVCMIVNAVGDAIPSFFIFPRTRFRNTVLFATHTGSLAFVNIHDVAGWLAPYL
jgi:hypothetical protein